MSTPAEEIIALDRSALDKWIRGDTLGWAALADADVTYFDTYAPARIDGTAAVSRHLAAVGENILALLRSRGKSQLDRYEMLNPSVQVFGDAAVLSYDWVVHIDSESQRWRATMVYARRNGTWRVVHAHWSVVSSPPPQS